jgi:hypothetical protein
MALAADDDVVVQADADRLQRVAHFAGQRDVVSRRRGVAGRVVVRHRNLYHFPPTLTCAQMAPSALL